MKQKRNPLSKRILLAYLFLFLALGVFSLFKKELIAVDRFSFAFLCFLFILIEKKYNVSPLTAFLAGLIFVPHEIGLFGFYGSPILNYNADLILHILTTFLFAYIVLNFLLQNTSNKFLTSAIIAISITITIGALIEALEYWGFVAIGMGEGYLGFGEGDNSQNFGPWEDSSSDTTANFFGSFLAVLIYWLFALLKNKFNDKKQAL